MEVIWSARAKITYFKVLDYLDDNWTKREIIQFSQRTQIVIQAIKRNPGMFPHSRKHGKIRKAYVDKNNSFFYQVDLQNNKIYLLTFFDNRQNPDKLKLV
jgi:hypothetical protein